MWESEKRHVAFETNPRKTHTHTTKTKHNIDGLFKTFRQRSLDLVSRVVYFLFIPLHFYCLTAGLVRHAKC